VRSRCPHPFCPAANWIPAPFAGGRCNAEIP